MNYLAHGWHFTTDPYYLAGTAAPDWLSVIDRKVRLRSRVAAPYCDDADPVVATLARGVLQHLADDAWFHSTTAFNELSLAFAVEIRDQLPGDEGFRPSFLGHILVEILLDATLAADDLARLDAYYAALASLDPPAAAAAIDRLATRREGCDEVASRLAVQIPRFVTERFLYDYLDDAKLLTRLNHVMRRVGLPQLPGELIDLFPAMRERVRRRKSDLLRTCENTP